MGPLQAGVEQGRRRVDEVAPAHQVVGLQGPFQLLGALPACVRVASSSCLSARRRRSISIPLARAPDAVSRTAVNTQSHAHQQVLGPLRDAVPVDAPAVSQQIRLLERLVTKVVEAVEVALVRDRPLDLGHEVLVVLEGGAEALI